MSLRPAITFRNMPPSEAVERAIRDHMASLARFDDWIMRCRVVVEARHPRHRQGTLFHVRIGLTVPGGGIVVGHDAATDHAHEDVQLALRDAFDAARRQLEEFGRQRLPEHGAPGVSEPDGKGCGRARSPWWRGALK